MASSFWQKRGGFPQVSSRSGGAGGKALQGRGKFLYNDLKNQKGRTPALQKITPYNGFELGPIRPPVRRTVCCCGSTGAAAGTSAGSAAFTGTCPSASGGPRTKKDIDLIKYWVDVFQGKAAPAGRPSPRDYEACSMAYHWVQSGMESVFFQDGNSLLMPPTSSLTCWVPQRRFPPDPAHHHLCPVAHHQPPEARAAAALCPAKLNRFHIGLETGNDEILKRMRKGVTKQAQIEAGIKGQGRRH